VRLDTKNFGVRGELGRFDPARSDQAGRLVDGWVEWIGRAILLAPRDLEYAKFLTISPASLFYFADSEVGEPWRRQFAEIMTFVAPGTEWADRYEFLASGAAGTFTSGLEPMRVEVPAGTTETPGEFQAPVPVRARDIVNFVPGSTPIPRPGRAWLRVENASLQDGGTITSDANFIAYDPRTYPWLELMQMEARSVFGCKAQKDGVLVRRYPTADDDIPEAILLAGNYDWNWYHWMIEYLPRVLDVPAGIGPDVPVIVTDRVLPAGIEALREFTDRPVRVVDVHASQRVGLLHVAPPLGKINDWLLGDWLAGYSLDPESLHGMRAGWGVDAPRTGKGRRVFLRRSTRARTVKNQTSIERLLSRRGFEVVDPSTLTLSEQRELFSSAEVVVGASGAVMTNYLFMRPGSAVIALTSRQLYDYLPPATLAEVAGLKFRYVVGRSRPPRRAKTVMGLVHADFRISMGELRRALEDTLSELDRSPTFERSSTERVSVPLRGAL
jgi:Glycosyltransferase 61